MEKPAQQQKSCFGVSLKEQCHEIFDFSFFNEPIFPKVHNILEGTTSIFYKILKDMVGNLCHWYRW